MTNLFPETKAEALSRQLRCVEREVKMRERVYPRWIDNGKMTREFADQEIATMREVAALLAGMLSEGLR